MARKRLIESILKIRRAIHGDEVFLVAVLFEKQSGFAADFREDFNPFFADEGIIALPAFREQVPSSYIDCHNK